MRSIPIDREQAVVIEEVGLELLRVGDHRASKLLALALAWRVAPSAAPSTETRRQLAEVIAIDTFSRKVGA